MMKIENNRVIIEFPDLRGFEEDILFRLPTELCKLLQCATILQVEHDWELDSTFYSVYSLLGAINPSMGQVRTLHFCDASVGSDLDD
ncbi:hypothetical protein [Taibaiella chishuiensis]|uniref:Uncharacterized protein n=1 Tax=Taibaiella chishuiensis TaxID=1434707 RepID=A0A2P8D0U4_9BACT|nr:hypothetical protein [Taibaiella chishuiensis]PSK90839.1 hypothetical protein B0I18_107251 [Taibaiella chishuiensis]